MSIEHALAPARPSDDALRVELAPPLARVDEVLIEVASELTPGKALLLGCANPTDVVWLAQEGWAVTAVDGDEDSVAQARLAASEAGCTAAFVAADTTAWRPTSRYDLVVVLFSLPARGQGRSRMLETAVAAVAPGGTIVVSELDMSLYRSGRMAERHLASLDELERYLDGFRIRRSAVRLVGRPHGFEELTLPAAQVVAMRRTDLRSL